MQQLTQPPLFAPESDWTPPAPETWPTWPERGRVSVDLETKDPDLFELGPGWARPDTSYVVGVAISIEDGPSLYLPVAHEGGDNVENPAAVWEYLRTEASAFKGTLLNHHIQYDLLWLAAHGVTFPNVSLIRDTEIAEVLLDDLAVKYNLEACCAKHGLAGKDEVLLNEASRYYVPAGKHRKTTKIGVKENMWRLPARFVGPYAEQDTRAVLRLSRRQERVIDQDELWEAYNLESACIPVLVDMTRRGVAIDEDRLDQFETWALTQRNEAVQKFNQITGAKLHVHELNTPAITGRALSDYGVALPLTATGRPSVDKDALARHKGNPAVDAFQTAKRFDTALGKFVVGTRRCVVNGRIHTVFNQSKRERGDGAIAGAVTGRLSSSNPNLQNQPNRDKLLAKPWRSIFRPDDGGLWACRDYSEQEPRLIVHYAEAFGLRGARAAGDRYRTDATTSFHNMMAEFTGLPRDDAKQVMLAKAYGAGIPKMAVMLGGRTVQEAEKINQQFDFAVPFISKLAEKCCQKAARDGYIPTLMGRILRFPVKEHGYGYEFTHKAMNRFIQGSAAMQTKKAMVDAYRAGIPLQLQVHDELNNTVETPDQAQELAAIMRDTVTLRVPSRVTVKVGPSWGEIVPHEL